MSFPQLSYPTPISTAPSMSTSQLLTPPTPTTVATSCCENGRPVMTDPHTGQTVCSCRYSSTLLSASYPAAARVPGLESVYNSAAYATQGYGAFAADPSAFYSPLNSAYGLKDNIEAWRTLSQSASAAACYPYDTTGMTTAYPYMNSYGAMDLNGARRKNATRESTSTLKAWLQEHIKNPYPTKGEKIMLAIITKMTLTQVSTWFANARRRLKKENKMTWSPKNRCDDDDDDVSIKSDDDLDDVTDKKKTDIKSCSALGSPRNDDGARSESDNQSDRSPSVTSSDLTDRNTHLGQFQPNSNFKTSDSCGDDKSQTKPKIWSLAMTATSKSPPLSRRSPINLSQSMLASRPSTITSSSMDVPSLWGKSPLYSSMNYPNFSRYSLGSMPYPTATKPTIGGSDLSQSSSLSSRIPGDSHSQLSNIDSLVHPAFGAFRPVEKVNQLAK